MSSERKGNYYDDQFDDRIRDISKGGSSPPPSRPAPTNSGGGGKTAGGVGGVIIMVAVLGGMRACNSATRTSNYNYTPPKVQFQPPPPIQFQPPPQFQFQPPPPIDFQPPPPIDLERLNREQEELNRIIRELQRQQVPPVPREDPVPRPPEEMVDDPDFGAEEQSAEKASALDDAVKKELAKMQGVWHVVSGEENGDLVSEYVVKHLKWAITGDQLIFSGIAPLTDKASKLAITIDASTTPKCIDYKIVVGSWKDTVFVAVYEWKGDELKVCIHLGSANRPVEFGTKAGSNKIQFVLKREKP